MQGMVRYADGRACDAWQLAQEGSCREEAWEFQWGMSNASEGWEAAHGWPPDPEWTESNWPAGGVPEYRLYQVGSALLHAVAHAPIVGGPLSLWMHTGSNADVHREACRVRGAASKLAKCRGRWKSVAAPNDRVHAQSEAEGLEGRLLIAGLLVGAVSFAAMHAAQSALQR